MPRGVKNSKKQESGGKDLISADLAVVKNSESLKKYRANREIALLGAVTYLKDNEKDERSIEMLAGSLSPDQVAYLNMRAEGLTTVQICNLLGINRASVLLWEEEELFKTCANIVKRIEADDAEEILWMMAKGDPKASAERIAGLKARKKEYQDGAGSAGFNPKVEIFLGGKPIDLSQNLKSAGSD